jgi:23S rRNA pseudouridine1911/1915/1917 synthase
VSRPFRVTFLFEDDDLIAVDKPEGLPTIAAEGSRGRSLYDIVTDHIRKRNPKGRAAVVHRLDRDTSGVMVFAKNGAAKARLMGSWNELVAQRRYVALVDGLLPEAEGVLDSWLSEASPGRMRESRTPSRGSLRAVTRYRVLSTGPIHSLVELSLETGRKHQIRVQLAGAGCPVSGDDRYGSRTDPLERLCLHASLIEINQGPGKMPLRFESPVPPGFAKAVTTITSLPGGTSTSRSSARGKTGHIQESRPTPNSRQDSGSTPRYAARTGSTSRHAARTGSTSRHALGTGPGRGRKRGELPEARPGGRASNSFRGDHSGQPGTKRSGPPGVGTRQPKAKD